MATVVPTMATGSMASPSTTMAAAMITTRFTVLPTASVTCVKIKILRRVRAESSRRPHRHRRDACLTAWRCEFLAARPSQDGRVVAEK